MNKLRLLLLAVLPLPLAALVGTAQTIVPEANSTNTQVTPNGNQINITGGQLSGDGANLFHSFTKFNLDAGQIANFNSNPTIQNIFGRISSGEASLINGLLTVTGGNSNLFLMNPAGILFGPNARLDVPGAFTATTATAIGFNSGWFNAIGDNNWATLVGTPTAWDFSIAQPGAIVNLGELTVSPGNDLTLLGGTVLSTGSLTAPGGNLTVVAVPGSNTLRISQPGHILTLEISAVPNHTFFNPATLPQLLAGGGGNATTVRVLDDGTVQLTGSGVRVEAGDITINQNNWSNSSSVTETLEQQQSASLLPESTFNHVTLAADQNLNLVNTKIQATGDIQLQAGETLQVRDGLISADRTLKLTANEIQMSAPQRLLNCFLGRENLEINAPKIISAAGVSFDVGGNFTALGDFNNSSSTSINATGNITLGNYTGTNLEAIAGGSITTGNITLPLVPESAGGGVSSANLTAGQNVQTGNIAGVGSGLNIRSEGSINAGDIIIDGIDGSSVILNSKNDLTARNIRISTNTTINTGIIVSSKEGNVDTSAGNIEIVTPNGPTGGISVYAGEGNVAAGGVRAGSVTVYAGGNSLTTGGDVAAQQEVQIISQGSIDTRSGAVTSQGGNITIYGDRDVTTSNVTSNGGNIAITSSRGVIDTRAGAVDGGGGNININAAVNFRGGRVSSNGGNVSIIYSSRDLSRSSGGTVTPVERPPVLMPPLNPFVLSPSGETLPPPPEPGPTLTPNPIPEPVPPPSTTGSAIAEPAPVVQPPVVQPPVTAPVVAEPTPVVSVPDTPVGVEPTPVAPVPVVNDSGNGGGQGPSSQPPTEFQPNADLESNVVAKNTTGNNISASRRAYSVQVPACWDSVRIGGVLREYQKAATCYEESLVAARQQQNPVFEEQTLNNLGVTYFQLGEYAKALTAHEQQLAIALSRQDPTAKGQALVGLGTVFVALGNYEKAIEYYQEGLQLIQGKNIPEWQGTALRNLGIAYISLKEYEKAISYQDESLKLALQYQDKRGEAQALGNLGIAYFSLGEYGKAIEYHQKHLQVMRQLKDGRGEGQALGNLGIAYHALEDYPKAIAYHQQHLAIAQKMGDRLALAHAYNNLGEALYKNGDLAAATQNFRSGIEILDSIRAGLGDDDLNKVSLFDTQTFIYKNLQEVLIAQNEIEAALEAAEQGRARAFAELLLKNQAGGGCPVEAVDCIPEQRTGTKQPFNTASPKIAEIKALANSHNSTLVTYTIIQEPFNIQGRRRVWESEMYIWVVKPTGEIAFRRADLKSLWRQKDGALKFAVEMGRCFEAFCRVRAERENPPLGGSNAVSDASSTKDVNANLYKILIAPIADLLPPNPEERVTFIPLEELFLVPFAALPDEQGKYLIEKHTILTAPSMQVLSLTAQRRNSLRQKWQNTPSSPVLVVGNPTMPQVQFEFGNAPVQLSPLPAAEVEAKEIASILGQSGDEFAVELLTGAAATKATVVQEMPKARFVHLATHGLLDDFQGKGLPGAVALAPSGGDDGLLSAAEIANLNLNAELVVLSACDTGRGRITGDGVIGLSRSLLGGGAAAVVVSLWAVPDGPTAELMTLFYRQLLVKSDKAWALRQAMLQMMQQHPNPRDWAAFTLMGESD
ncbi:CHAT domain-containing protein [[Phormidium] sp. ETS-05]|uniref:CHAT domain-containing protein n=1 Tax=[Phormidium] sp. ETS-05 TaxID=222819 RepID=UPI0018EEE86C|nr:CHAT domain-containing protein [[Phormidium] sp. ETS-05]